MRTARIPTLTIHADVVVGIGLLATALVIGLATAHHYGLTCDEFNTDEYGPKALAWYVSGFTDRSHLETGEAFLWYYGPWHQILTALVQSFKLTDPFTIRHAMTFLAGLAAVAALVPIVRLSVGPWAAPVAIVLCLMTGYFYGSLFFTPIDVPFMAAITWATYAILVMARGGVPSWPATAAAGALTGLAMATRTGGIITHAYLIAAMTLCALEVALRERHTARRSLAYIGIRTLAAMAIAWIVMIALWPWLQIGNPLRQFAVAYVHFANNTLAFSFPSWGELIATNELPWYYIPGQLLARLPEGFLLLLGVGFVLAAVTTVRFARATVAHVRRRGIEGLTAPALVLARARGTLLVIVAALVPVGFVIVTRATHYDGVRHVLFVIPMLALLASGALVQALPWLRRFPPIAATVIVVAATHVGFTVTTLVRLHPLEYVAMNALAGGTRGAAGRFELDYWSIAATEALRRLEFRLDHDISGRFATTPPHVLVCIGHREWLAGRLFRRNWVVETDGSKADFVITTERWDCDVDTKTLVLIDEVKRLDTTFARTYAVARQ